MYGARVLRISSMLSSSWMFRSIALERSRLKIPIIDFASITYLPDTRSKSVLKFVTSFTNALTLSIEFKEIFTVFITITSSLILFSFILDITGRKVNIQCCQKIIRKPCEECHILVKTLKHGKKYVNFIEIKKKKWS